jgi:hypothetical protein
MFSSWPSSRRNPLYACQEEETERVLRRSVWTTTRGFTGTQGERVLSQHTGCRRPAGESRSRGDTARLSNAPVNGHVDGRPFRDAFFAVLADLGAHDDFQFPERPALLAVFDSRLDALVRLGRVHNGQALALERAREPVRAARGDEAVQDGGFGDGCVGVGGRRGDRVGGVVQVKEGRVGAGDGDPREGVEARVAAMEADCMRT